MLQGVFVDVDRGIFISVYAFCTDLKPFQLIIVQIETKK